MGQGAPRHRLRQVEGGNHALQGQTELLHYTSMNFINIKEMRKLDISFSPLQGVVGAGLRALPRDAGPEQAQVRRALRRIRME